MPFQPKKTAYIFIAQRHFEDVNHQHLGQAGHEQREDFRHILDSIRNVLHRKEYDHIHVVSKFSGDESFRKRIETLNPQEAENTIIVGDYSTMLGSARIGEALRLAHEKHLPVVMFHALDAGFNALNIESDIDKTNPDAGIYLYHRGMESFSEKNFLDVVEVTQQRKKGEKRGPSSVITIG